MADNKQIRKGSMTHRSIDVDQYDEERYIEADETDAGSGSALAGRQSQVRQLLSSGKAEDALKIAISEPLYKAEASAKDESVKLVSEVIAQFKTADIQKAVSAMKPEEVDVLLKYVYRGMEFPETGSCAALLAFHKALCETDEFATRGIHSALRSGAKAQ